MILVLILAGLFYGAHTTPTPSSCPSCVQVRLGAPSVLYGPAGEPLDNPFIAIDVQGSLLGYSANGNTEIIAKGDLNKTIPPASAPIVLKRGSSTSFDSCGAWLNAAVVVSSTTVRGWYHAECWCNYSNDGQTHKSVAYAESNDGGLSFTKVNYPNNHVITGTNASVNGRTTGNGDHSVVVGNDGYYYMYFFDWDATHTAVARSLISDGGIPGTWFKYYEGNWNEPGLGGKTSYVPSMYSYTVLALETGELTGVRGVGAGITFASDPITWSPESVPILYSEDENWTRSAQSMELVAYPTLIAESGSGPLGSNFWLYYTYLYPGQGFGDRYLVRRPVSMSISDTPVSPQSGTALVRYLLGEDYWSTTGVVPSNYSYDAALGFMFPEAYPGTFPLYDCYIPSWNDHMIGISVDECSDAGVVLLRSIGWVYNTEPSIPPFSFLQIFRCFDVSILQHYVSTSEDCDNKGKLDFELGWILAE